MNAARASHRRWPRTLAAKFLLVVLLGVLLPIGLVGVWLTQSAGRSGRSLLREQLELAGDVLSANAQERWALRDGELSLVTNNSVTSALLAGRAMTADDSVYMKGLLHALERSIAFVSVRDATGQDRWTSEEHAKEQPSPEDDGTPPATTSSRVTAAAPQLPVKRSIVVNGRKIGLLTARVRLSSLLRLDSLPLLTPGAVLVIRDSTGLLWASSPSLPVALDEAISPDWEVVHRTLQGSSLELEIYAPSAPFVTPFKRAARTGLIVLSLAIVLSLMLTLVLTSRLTRSLHALSLAAADVAQGKLDHTVKIESDDEVGQLAVAFNGMTESLRVSLTELAGQRSLAAVGEFAASLSHEVRNALTAVRVDLQHANRHLEADHPGRPLVSRTLDSVRRLDATVTSALRVARGGNVQRVPVSLNEVLQRAMRAAHPTFAERGAVLEALVESPWPVIHGDGAALEALFLNLLLNAAQASQAGGATRVRVAQDGLQALVTISDDGGGVPASQLASLGKAFHSTRTDGTGLGLPIARRIAESHGGELRVESENGNGTTVSVELPMVVSATH